MKRLLVLALVGLMITGCVDIVQPSHRVAIHDTATLAADMDERVQADANCPSYVKTYSGANARSWAVLDAWSHGKPIPQEVEYD